MGGTAASDEAVDEFEGAKAKDGVVMLLQREHYVKDVPSEQLGFALGLCGEAGEHGEDLDVRRRGLLLDHVNELLGDAFFQELYQVVVRHVGVSCVSQER